MIRMTGLLGLAALCLIGCAGPTESGAASGRVTRSTSPELTVFCAASLTECLDAFNAEYEAANPGIEILVSYAGTQELITQVQQGARADVFVSAAASHMKILENEGYVAEPEVFAHNRLCVVTARGGEPITDLSQLGEPNTRIVVTVDTCPAGKYTRECWDKMADSADAGPELVASLKANVVSEETNVKLVVSKVALGEADAGFVYITDAAGVDVDVLELAEQVQVQSTYLVATLADAPEPAASAAYIQALCGELGSKHLAEGGLIIDAAPAGH